MQELLANFFETPNADHYRAVRDAVIQHPTFSSTGTLASEIQNICRSLEQRDFAAARQQIASHMPGWSLCPRIHFLDGLAAEGLELADEVEVARFCFRACLDGLLATGDGTSAHPYVVTYVTDEQDILQSRRRQAIGQSLIERMDRRFDVISCATGDKLWFDVTALVVAAPMRVSASSTAADRGVRVTGKTRRGKSRHPVQ